MRENLGFVQNIQGVVSYALYPTEDIDIKWHIVSNEFRNDFYICWEKACALLTNELDENIGANVMCMLDIVGDMVNHNEINEKTFEQAYEFACEESLAELNK